MQTNVKKKLSSVDYINKVKYRWCILRFETFFHSIFILVIWFILHNSPLHSTDLYFLSLQSSSLLALLFPRNLFAKGFYIIWLRNWSSSSNWSMANDDWQLFDQFLTQFIDALVIAIGRNPVWWLACLYSRIFWFIQQKCRVLSYFGCRNGAILTKATA